MLPRLWFTEKKICASFLTITKCYLSRWGNKVTILKSETENIFWQQITWENCLSRLKSKTQIWNQYLHRRCMFFHPALKFKLKSDLQAKILYNLRFEVFPCDFSKWHPLRYFLLFFECGFCGWNRPGICYEANSGKIKSILRLVGQMRRSSQCFV